MVAGILAISVCAATLSVPANALKHLPELKEALIKNWPDMPKKSVMGGQIEQESCISLKSARCWNPNVELKTSREYGFGLGQVTISYDKNGKTRFNNFEQAKLDFPTALKDWKWENRFDASYQMTTIILMDKKLYNRVGPLVSTKDDQLAFMLSSYNGGFGGVLQDRKLCQATKDCNANVWFGNVENYSFKSKIKVQGYGESAYAINRGYVRQVLNERRQKYIPYLE